MLAKSKQQKNTAIYDEDKAILHVFRNGRADSFQLTPDMITLIDGFIWELKRHQSN